MYVWHAAINRHLCFTRSNVPPWKHTLQMPGDRLPICGGSSIMATAAALAASLMTCAFTGGDGIESIYSNEMKTMGCVHWYTQLHTHIRRCRPECSLVAVASNPYRSLQPSFHDLGPPSPLSSSPAAPAVHIMYVVMQYTMQCYELGDQITRYR